MRSFRKIFFTVAALAATVPLQTFACAACYGRSDSPLAHGMNWGIFTLMGVIVTVLVCIAAFFVHVVRKEAELNKNPDQQKPTDV